MSSKMIEAKTGGGMVASGRGMGSTRDSRAQEAIKMKDEQLRILTEQNSHLLRSLDSVEEEANTMQLEKLAVEEENRKLRDQNFELQSKARADAAMRKAQAEMADRDKQLKIMTDQIPTSAFAETEGGADCQTRERVRWFARRARRRASSIVPTHDGEDTRGNGGQGRTRRASCAPRSCVCCVQRSSSFVGRTLKCAARPRWRSSHSMSSCECARRSNTTC